MLASSTAVSECCYSQSVIRQVMGACWAGLAGGVSVGFFLVLSRVLGGVQDWGNACMALDCIGGLGHLMYSIIR